MKNRPLPNLDGGNIRPSEEADKTNWYYKKPKEEDLYDKGPPFNVPIGWGNPWPDLPNPDDNEEDFDFKNINLRIPSKRSRQPFSDILGYYISWHIVGVSFKNEYGREPNNGKELEVYNLELPSENRFGIHIICPSIERYINKFDTNGIEPNHIDDYKEYCAYLTLIYVIAHEWGHYRSEVLSFQATNLTTAITGEQKSDFSPSFLSYFVNKKRFPKTNFEEVFAEWAALKLGIFNYYTNKPRFTHHISNWPVIESTVKFMLTNAIARPNRIRPYSDIRFWINFDALSNDATMNRLSNSKTSMNRSVNDNLYLSEIKSFKKGKMIDLLMHNQLQFSLGKKGNGIIKSFNNYLYPINPDSAFYHFADDECVIAQKGSYTNKFLKLKIPQTSYLINYPSVKSALKNFNESVIDKSFLPIRVFPEILAIDPVYFHD